MPQSGMCLDTGSGWPLSPFQLCRGTGTGLSVLFLALKQWISNGFRETKKINMVFIYLFNAEKIDNRQNKAKDEGCHNCNKLIMKMKRNLQ